MVQCVYITVTAFCCNLKPSETRSFQTWKMKLSLICIFVSAALAASPQAPRTPGHHHGQHGQPHGQQNDPMSPPADQVIPAFGAGGRTPPPAPARRHRNGAQFALAGGPRRRLFGSPIPPTPEIVDRKSNSATSPSDEHPSKFDSKKPKKDDGSGPSAARSLFGDFNQLRKLLYHDKLHLILHSCCCCIVSITA